MNIKFFLKIIFIYFYKKEINFFKKAPIIANTSYYFMHQRFIYREEKRREAKGNHSLTHKKKKERKIIKAKGQLLPLTRAKHYCI
jgi:hypothetical protein